MFNSKLKTRLKKMEEKQEIIRLNKLIVKHGFIYDEDRKGFSTFDISLGNYYFNTFSTLDKLEIFLNGFLLGVKESAPKSKTITDHTKLHLLQVECPYDLEISQCSTDQENFKIKTKRKFIESPCMHTIFEGNYKECKDYLNGFCAAALWKKRDKSDKKILKNKRISIKVKK